jgi:hypothetical protein
MVKTCTKCNNEYPATTEFWYKHPAGKYGLKSICTVCVLLGKKKHYNTPGVKDKMITYNAKYRAKNHEKAKEWARKSYHKNKDKNRIKRYEYDNKPENRRRARKYINKYRSELPPPYVAYCLGVNVKDLDPEVYDIQKLIIQLKRKLGITNIAKSDNDGRKKKSQP